MRIFGAMALALLLAASTAAADEGVGLVGTGARAGFRLDPNQLVLGGHLDLGDIVTNLRAMPNATIGFGDDATIVSIDPEVHYCFRDNPISPGTWFYAGGGLDFLFWNPDDAGEKSVNRVGASLTGGISHSLSDSQSLMAEIRIVLVENSFVEIVGAWNFGR
jgi:hypothetical protein